MQVVTKVIVSKHCDLVYWSSVGQCNLVVVVFLPFKEIEISQSVF